MFFNCNTPGLICSCFNGRIQRKKVGLISNADDHPNDFANFLRIVIQAVDLLDDFFRCEFCLISFVIQAINGIQGLYDGSLW